MYKKLLYELIAGWLSSGVDCICTFIKKKKQQLTTMKNKEKFADLKGLTNSLCNLIQEL